MATVYVGYSNRETDTAACLAVLEHAKRMLADPSLNMVLLDEITYMVAYDYLPLEAVLDALRIVLYTRRLSSRGAGVIGIFWRWPIPSASCVRSNMRLMQASKRKLELITKEKSPVRSPGFYINRCCYGSGAAAAAHLAVSLHRATDLIRLHATTIFFHRPFEVVSGVRPTSSRR